MLKSIIKTSGYVSMLAWTGMVCATGLGGINVSTYLGQPLKAEIELVSVEKTDRSSITAKLASPDAFKSAGVDYPYSLPKLKFEAVNLNSPSPSIRITSAQPVNDPFVTLLIEVTWSSGKLLREYTFLLDPADFKVEEPKAAPVTPIAPVVSTPTPVVQAPQPVVQEIAPAEATPPSDPVASQVPAQEQPADAAPVTAEQAPKQVASVKKIPATKASSRKSVEPAVLADSVKVARGDSLSKIAIKNKPTEVSLERMLVAMYRANPDAFEGNNMNRLKTGKIVKLPDASGLDAVQQEEALKEINAQVSDWNAYRQQLSSVHTKSIEKVDHQSVSGKIKSAVKDEAAATKDSAKEVLKLSKGEAPNDKAVGAGKVSAQEKASAKEEESVAKNKALKEAEERNALLEKNVKDLQRLAELKKQNSAAQLSVAASAPTPVVTAGDGLAASAPVAKPKVANVPKVIEPQVASDDMLADPVMLAGGAAALLGLGGAGFYFMRRKNKTASPVAIKSDTSLDEEIGNATGRIASPVIPSPDTGDFTQLATNDQSMQGGDEVDPIGEADLFLTFGRDAQAEEVLKEALKTNPANTPVRLKLLSIYANRSDSDEFFTHASVIKDSGDSAAWDKAAELGRAIDPTNPLYGGVGSGVANSNVQQKADLASPSVDFDLGFGGASPTDKSGDFLSTLVMDTPVHEITAVLTPEELRSSQDAPMDFDVTGTHPGTQAMPLHDAASLSTEKTDDMMFDITSSRPGLAQSALMSSASDVAAASSVDDLVFDITSAAPAAVSAAPKLPNTPAIAEDFGFMLDFPTTAKTDAPAKPDVPADIGFGDISLNLDSLKLPTSGVASGAKDERWQEVATKLDLAKAYQEMGDDAGAKEILEEVLRDGDEQQRSSANAMLQNI